MTRWPLILASLTVLLAPAPAGAPPPDATAGGSAGALPGAGGDLITIGRLRYRGGGDWYGDTTSLVNLLRALRDRFGWNTASAEVVVEPGDEALFDTPFLFMAGHGRVVFSDAEAERLRRHLTHGGFLFADDDYGMDESFRPALRKVFPDRELVEVPFDHEIYRVPYEFPQGLPKIHEHHGGAPQGLGIFDQGRLVVFYSYNTDIGDGLENEDVHHDPAENREAALRMAINIAHYAVTH